MADSIGTPEEWRAIPGYEGAYEVSDLGRVRSLDRTTRHTAGGLRKIRGKFLKSHANKDGHLTLMLAGRKHWFVHQLVLLAFVGPYPSGMQVCHNNGVHADNRISNLRYDTATSNNLDRIEHGVHHEANKTHCPQKHAYDLVNTYWHTRPDGRVCRKCKTCRRAQFLAFHERKRSANARSRVAS